VCLLIETEDRFGLRRLIAGLLPPLVIVGGWLLFARLYFGTFWPQTLAAKTVGGSALGVQLDNAWRQVRVIGATDGVLMALLAMGIVLARGPRSLGIGSAHRWLPWAWVIALPALYVTRGVEVLSRYVLVVAPILAWLAWRAAERWWTGSSSGQSSERAAHAGLLAAAVTVLVLTQNFLVFEKSVIPHVRSFTPGLRQSLIHWGQWFARNTPANAVIATPDIGAIGYFSQRSVVDLAGLVTPAMVPLLARETPEEAVASFGFAAFSRPDYLVDRGPTPYALRRASPFGEALVPLGFTPMPRLGISASGPTTYSYYRVDWAAFDSLRAAPSGR
jgi:hypothetical protein